MRFNEPEQAAAALDKTENGKMEICECDATLKLLEGQEEEDYFREVCGRLLLSLWHALCCLMTVPPVTLVMLKQCLDQHRLNSRVAAVVQSAMLTHLLSTML